MSPKQKKMIAIGALVVGVAYLLLSKSGGGGGTVQLGMEPAAVTAGKLVSVETYRVIESLRPGMQASPISSGQIGGMLEFTPTVTGMFTRNIVQQGGQLVAEIKG